MDVLRSPPEAFLTACEALHQDILLTHGSVEDLAAASVRSLDQAAKRALARWLDKVLAGDHTSAELRGLFQRSPADVGFSSASARAYLEALRNESRN